MSLKIKIIEEIIKKIQYGIKNNEILRPIKNIYVGSISQARTSQELPFINIFIKNVKETPSLLKGLSINEIDLLIRLVCNKNKGNNTYYKNKNNINVGPIVILDKLLNVLDKDVKDILDLSFNSNILEYTGYNYEFLEENDLLIFNINFFINSSNFSLGNR